MGEEYILEIIIRDTSYRKIEKYKVSMNNKKLCKKFISIIEQKYGLMDIKEDKIKEEKPKDPDWLNLENDFLP